MNALKLVTIGVAFLFFSDMKGQVSVSINIGSQPQWGPVGYIGIRYYYLPDVEAYYDIQSSMFIYYGGGQWIYRAYLPSQYSRYDLYGGYKVVITDYRGPTPYIYFKQHRGKYGKGYRSGIQKTIGVKPGNKYSNGKTAPKGNSGEKAKQHNGKGKIH